MRVQLDCPDPVANRGQEQRTTAHQAQRAGPHTNDKPQRCRPLRREVVRVGIAFFRPSSSASTSSHVKTSSGFFWYCSIRRSRSFRWASVSGIASCSPDRLSHNSSMRQSRSLALRDEIASFSILRVMRDSTPLSRRGHPNPQCTFLPLPIRRSTSPPAAARRRNRPTAAPASRSRSSAENARRRHPARSRTAYRSRGHPHSGDIRIARP